jgi:hypothetical protein
MLLQELTRDLDFDESAADATVIARKEAALEELADWVRRQPPYHLQRQALCAQRVVSRQVDDINNANDLKAIGGLAVLVHHLHSAHAGIRWRACEVCASVN